MLRPVLVSLFSILILVLAGLACVVPATPTPTPTVTPPALPPTATPTAIPTPTATATPLPPTATPTPTPTATPTATPTPTPTPTATATPLPPTVTPTPTPTPPIEAAIPKVEPAVVRISANQQQWSGVVIEADGVILTTGTHLSLTPLVSVRLPTGEVVNGWVQGRHDPLGVAIIIVQQTGLVAAELGDSSGVSVGNELIVLGFQHGKPDNVSVTGTGTSAVRGDIGDGATFLQTAAEVKAGMEGGPVIDHTGKVVGLRVTNSVVEEAGIPIIRGGFALAINDVVPRIRDLKEGLFNVAAKPPLSPDPRLGPPPVPAIFSGKVTFRGTTAPEGNRLYLRLIKSGLRDAWFQVRVKSGGTYTAVVAAPNALYGSGNIEFWMDAREAQQTPLYRPGRSSVVDLTFP